MGDRVTGITVTVPFRILTKYKHVLKDVRLSKKNNFFKKKKKKKLKKKKKKKLLN